MTEAYAPMTEMTQPRKFLFDLSFDGEEDSFAVSDKEKEKQKPIYTQDQMDAALEEARAEGRAAGTKAAEETQAKKTNERLDRLVAQLDKLYQASAETWAGHMDALRGLALVIARKVMPTYIATNGMEEIETIVAKVVGEMRHEPRLVIRVAESVFEEANARVTAIAANRAYAGKLVVLGDASMGPSDCLVEWADGGIERNVAALYAEIEQAVGRVALPPAQESSAADAVPSLSNDSPDAGETK